MTTPWREMTEEQKARQREYCRRSREKPEQKARQLERHRRWNEKNRDRKRANDRKWYARKKTDTLWMSGYRAMRSFIQIGRVERMRTDPEYYAHTRRYHREWIRRRIEANGGVYVPKPSRRVPDWFVLGQCEEFAKGSSFLRENMSREELMSCDGYAIELARERRERRK